MGLNLPETQSSFLSPQPFSAVPSIIMTKATQTLTAAIVTVVIYLAFYLGVIPTSSTFQSEVLPVVPFWALVAFGAYALGTLGWGVYSFQDKEAEYKILLDVSSAHRVFATHFLTPNYRKSPRPKLNCVPRELQWTKSLVTLVLR